MQEEERIIMDCPYCGGSIEKPLSFFRKTFSTCPCCERGLSAGQFARLVEEIDAAFDAGVEEMILGSLEKSGCCGKGDSCCKTQSESR